MPDVVLKDTGVSAVLEEWKLLEAEVIDQDWMEICRVRIEKYWAKIFAMRW